MGPCNCPGCATNRVRSLEAQLKDRIDRIARAVDTLRQPGPIPTDWRVRDALTVLMRRAKG